MTLHLLFPRDLLLMLKKIIERSVIKGDYWGPGGLEIIYSVGTEGFDFDISWV
jgi:hypothetical protein